jgi:hypothetical protein
MVPHCSAGFGIINGRTVLVVEVSRADLSGVFDCLVNHLLMFGELVGRLFPNL